MNYVFAIDPGTGSSSPAAICLYDRIEKEVIWSYDLWPLGYKARGGSMTNIHRIKLIIDQMDKIWADTITKFPINQIGISIENFVMQGKGGATLQMFRGAALCVFPPTQKIVNVQNSAMKKIAGGKGSADKEQIAISLIEKLPKSAEYIKELKDLEAWDQIDAIGLAYAADFS